MELEITFGLIAKLASADGAVSTTEIKVVEKLIDEVLKFDQTQKNLAIEAFNKGKKSADSFSTYAENYKKLVKDKPEMLPWMLDILVKISYADKSFSEREVDLLKQASKIFDVPLTKYEKYFGKKNIDAELSKLGANSTESIEQITEKYNLLSEEYSPEKIKKLGLAKDFVELAETRTAELSKAFSEIKKHFES